MKIEFNTIGTVETNINEQTDLHWGEVTSQIVIDKSFQDGLLGLEEFSHIIVVYYLNEAKFESEKHLVRHPQGRTELPKVGILSQRAKDRPNPIGITAVKLISVKDNIITVKGLDAINGTPVLDIKPYFPQYDCKPEATTADWANVIMKEYF